MILPTATAGPLSSCFVYGTLTSREVVTGLIGRCPPMVPAVLRSHRRHPVKSAVYPGVVHSGSSTDIVRGMLMTEIRPDELVRFDWFEDEGEDYSRVGVNVLVKKRPETRSTSEVAISVSDQLFFLNGDDPIDDNEWTQEVSTNVYIWARPDTDLDTSSAWSYKNFRDQDLDTYLRTTVKYCRKEMDRLRSGVDNSSR